MRVPLRIATLSMVCSVLALGASTAQPPPPKPPEPAPKASQVTPPQPAGEFPADSVWRVTVVPLPGLSGPVGYVPAASSCGCFTHRCGRCGRSYCDSYTPYGGISGYDVYWRSYLVYLHRLTPEELNRVELNPQPLPPREDILRNEPRPITPERSAESLVQEGARFYWHGNAATALKLISAAIERDPQDAAAWYFKALAERSLGKLDQANESALRGAALETINRALSSQVGVALERVQGEERQFLRSAMTPDLTYDKARQIAMAPVKSDEPIVTK